MNSHRTIHVGTVPVYLPAYYPADLYSDFDGVAQSLVQSLLSGEYLSCLQLDDQSYPIQEAIWSTLLSFIAAKKKSAANGPAFRVVYVCSGYHTVKILCSLVDGLKKRLQVPDFDGIESIAFSEPANMCVNRKFLKLFQDSHNVLNAACRAAVSSSKCPHHARTCAKPTNVHPAPDALPDIEDIWVQLNRDQACPYYTTLSKMDDAHLIITTYEALKGTLNGQRLRSERLPLGTGTFLICDDAFAMEKTFEDCYDCILGVPLLERVIGLCKERKRHLWDVQQAVFPRSKIRREEFWGFVDNFCLILHKMRQAFEGEIPMSPDTAAGRLQLLKDIGLGKIDAKSLLCILSLLQVDIFNVARLRPYHIKTCVSDLINIKQFFHNLRDPFISSLLLKEDCQTPFRFWMDLRDHTPDKQIDLTEVMFKFFCVTVNVALTTLRTNRLDTLLCLCAVVPVSFQGIDPGLRFQINRRPLPDVIKSLSTESLFSAIFGMGPQDISFNCDLKQRDQPCYILALGQAIRELLHIIPGKVLLLFASASYYENCSALWKVDGTLRELSDMIQVHKPCGAAMCTLCLGHMANYQRRGRITVAFCRSGALDGVTGGYQCAVAVSLPYQYLGDAKIAAKQSFLKPFRTAAYDFYTQEAVNALAGAFSKITALDGLSARRGRIFIILDSRVKRNTRFLPVALSSTIKEYSNFDTGVTELKTFLKKIPHWNADEDRLMDPEVFSYIRQLQRSVKSADAATRVEIIDRICALVEHFEEHHNIDLLAAAIVAELRVQENCESLDFPVYIRPWLLNFGQFFFKSDFRAYWSDMIRNLLNQIGEKIAATQRQCRTRTEMVAAIPTPGGSQTPFNCRLQ